MSTVGLPDGINTTLLTIAVIIIITIIITINIYNLDHGPNINTMLNIIIIIILSNRISTSIFAAERVQMPKAPSFQKKIPNTSHPRPLKKPNARLAPEHGIGVHIEVIPSLPWWLGTRGLNPQICPPEPYSKPGDTSQISLVDLHLAAELVFIHVGVLWSTVAFGLSSRNKAAGQLQSRFPSTVKKLPSEHKAFVLVKLQARQQTQHAQCLPIDPSHGSWKLRDAFAIRLQSQVADLGFLTIRGTAFKDPEILTASMPGTLRSVVLIHTCVEDAVHHGEFHNKSYKQLCLQLAWNGDAHYCTHAHA